MATAQDSRRARDIALCVVDGAVKPPEGMLGIMSSIDSRLLEILACPVDRGSLLLVSGERLYNPRLHLLYRIDDGIPVLLQDEAEEVDAEQHELLMASVKD